MFNSNSSFWNSIPPATKHLLIINVLFWLATLTPSFKETIFNLLGLHFWRGSDFHFYQMFTYMFLHSGFSHLFFNMFALYMFGQMIEQVFGTKFFLLYYFITGLGAACLQEFTWQYTLSEFMTEINSYANSDLSGGLGLPNASPVYTVDALMAWADTVYNNFLTVGASGAVFGLLAAFAMLFPNQPMYIMFIPVPIKAKYVMIGYAILELFLGVSNFSGDNVAHFAHLGGAIVGVILVYLWIKTNKPNKLYE